jgi:carbonic anhydrase/acetyltransferase-like protein (isoleucine patch superfamily)
MALHRAEDTFVAPGAIVVGDVRMESESSVWFSATLNGERASVTLEPRANVQDNAVVEGTDGHPARIGARVSMGHNARVIGAIVEAGSLIAIGSTVLPGAVIGSQSIVAANATVPEDMVVPPRSLVIGSGRIARLVRDEEIARIERGAVEYARLCRDFRKRARGPLALREP